MEERIHSPNWYRVGNLKLRLRSHVRIHRHLYRGEVWYVLQDLSSDRFHRFSPETYGFIGLLDGDRTVQDAWELSCAKLEDHAPTQDQAVQLLGQLHAADLLQGDLPPNVEEILKRADKMRRKKWISQIASPLFWRIPLFDPEWILKRYEKWVAPAFGKTGLFAWLITFVIGVALTAIHWDDLTESVFDRVLSPSNLVLMWLLFPILKIFHEFGHAFAVKSYGGEVHEMGINFLVLTPFPYVDASAAWAFRSKRERLVVGASGMMVETFIAALALILWLNIEPGLFRSILYNIFFMASVSTILFNANPLLRFDGYYILADLIEIPNLRSRSTKYLTYLIQKFGFGMERAKPPISTRGERIWFVVFSISSFIYRILILVGIILFIATKFFFIGVLLALWGAIAWGLFPLFKSLRFVFTSPQLRRNRGRAVAATGSFCALLLIMTFVIPAPLNSTTEGVIWVPDQAIVRAGAEGFVHRFLADPGSEVELEQPLLAVDDPFALAEVKALEAQVEEVRVQRDAARTRSRVELDVYDRELAVRQQDLARARRALDELTVRAKSRGIFTVSQPEDLPGQFVQQGTPLAHVLQFGQVTARVIVDQDDIDLVMHNARRAEVRFANDPSETIEAAIHRIVPTASEQLPSAALGSAGGGSVATDPYDQQGSRAVEKLFQVDIAVPSDTNVVNIGGRVHVRFVHDWEPLAYRWGRSLRRLFLSRFDV